MTGRLCTLDPHNTMIWQKLNSMESVMEELRTMKGEVKQAGGKAETAATKGSEAKEQVTALRTQFNMIKKDML